MNAGDILIWIFRGFGALYVVRQRRRELRGATAVEAEAARVERLTVNCFYAALVMLALSAWLYVDGLLWWPRW